MLAGSYYYWWVNLQARNLQPLELMLLLFRYVETGTSISESVADTGELSEYANNEQKLLYHDLLESHPYVLDELLACSEEEVHQLKSGAKKGCRASN